MGGIARLCIIIRSSDFGRSFRRSTRRLKNKLVQRPRGDRDVEARYAEMQQQGVTAQVLSRLSLILFVTAVLYVGIGTIIHFHRAGSLLLLLLVAVLGALSMVAAAMVGPMKPGAVSTSARSCRSAGS